MMSTSFSAATARAAEQKDQPFPYPSVNPSMLAEVPMSVAVATPASEELIVQREQAAYASGREQGEAMAQTKLAEQFEQARESLRVALEGFAKEREHYYQRIEGEVVRLALNIAGKILHRESQVDPFFLAGLVRVALERLDSNTKVLIRVHPQHAADCRDFFARAMDAHHTPEIVEDASVEPGRSVLETDVGTSEIGIEPQLKEIELGLTDLLVKRPGNTTKP